jgi:hypothetical protein
MSKENTMWKIIFQLILSIFTKTKETSDPDNIKNNMEDRSHDDDDEDSPPDTIYPMW